MINRIRRSNYIPQGTGETAGLVVEDRSDRLVLDLGAVKGRRYLDGNSLDTKTAAFTLTNGEAGKTIVFSGTASVIATLPKAAAANKGAIYIFVVGSLPSSGAGHAVSPNAADTIIGAHFTPAANKDVICSAATDRLGDLLEVQSDGVSNWYVTSVIGTWAREA